MRRRRYWVRNPRDSRLRRLEGAVREGDLTQLDALYNEATRLGDPAFRVIHEVVAPLDLSRMALVPDHVDDELDHEWREWIVGVLVSWTLVVNRARDWAELERTLWRREPGLSKDYSWDDLVDSWVVRHGHTFVKLTAHATVSYGEDWCDDAIGFVEERMGIAPTGFWGEVSCAITYYETGFTSPHTKGGYFQA